MSKTTPEGKVKARVKDILAQAPGQIFSNWPVPGGYGESMLDCVGCHRGAFFAVETKAPGKQVTPRQQGMIDRMRAAGAAVFVIDDEIGIVELWGWLHRH